MTIEQLTDDVRARLALAGHEGPTALRIIDAHAADRAALVAQLEGAQERVSNAEARARRLAAEKSDIRQSAETAIYRIQLAYGGYKPDWPSGVVDAVSAFKRMAEASASGEDPTHAALVAQVAELTRERDEARKEAINEKRWAGLEVDRANRAEVELTRQTTLQTEAHSLRLAAESEVARLTEALAAAERRWQAAEQNVVWNRESRDAAEARVRELEGKVVDLEDELRWG